MVPSIGNVQYYTTPLGGQHSDKGKTFQYQVYMGSNVLLIMLH